MENLGLDALATVVLTGLVAGTVEFIKRIFDGDWRAATTIVAAGIVGGFGAMFFGATFPVGIVFGLAASGYITIAQNIGK